MAHKICVQARENPGTDKLSFGKPRIRLRQLIAFVRG
jgi:hypothetical protein